MVIMSSPENMQIFTQSFSQQIYDRLRSAILRGDYKCGDVINAKTVAAEMGVSMMPVREALKRLEQNGLVEIRPRSMCLVRTPSKKTIISAMKMRELLEVFCVKQIYETIDADKLNTMRKLNLDMEEAFKLGEEGIKKFIYCDWQFHCELCNLADNEFVSSFYPELYIKVNMGIMYELSSPDINYMTFVEDHRQLIEALENHSPSSVEIIERHMKNSQKNIMTGHFFLNADN